MPFAVAHTLIPILILNFFRKRIGWFKKNITKNRLIVAGFCGFAPDLDIPIGFALGVGFDLHRTITHSFFLPALVLIMAIFAGKLKTGFLFAAFGLAMHILLDLMLTGTLMPFYPLGGDIGLKLLVEDVGSLYNISLLIGLELAVLAIWIWYNKLFLFKK